MILVSTLHDIDGSLFNNIAAAAKKVHEHYDKWVVRVTGTTDQRVISRLEQFGVIIIGKEAANAIEPLEKRFVENDHLIAFREAVRVADERDDNIIQYQDGDRVIMAATMYPEEFSLTARLVEQRMKEHEGEEVHLNLRRSGLDYLTHHAALLQTELRFNIHWSKALGMPYDIGSTNHAMTKEVMREVTDRALDLRPATFPHPKLPIIAKQMGAVLLSDETYGVGAFETPLQMKDAVKKEIETRGGTLFTPNATTTSLGISELHPDMLDHDYQLLTDTFKATVGLNGRQGNLNPAEWTARFVNVREYLAILGDHVRDFVDDPSRQKEIEDGIRAELASVSREETMLQALWPEGKLPDDPRASIEDMLRNKAEEVGQEPIGQRHGWMRSHARR